MRDANDMELLQEYVRNGSEPAFTELVQRHVNLVYSAAFRHVEIAAQAEEISQAVFVILAQKAGALRSNIVLAAWLYETTRLTAISFLRGERRRQFREQEAYMQSTLQDSTSDPTWEKLAPLLDESISRLGAKDRQAVILRFFKNQSMREVALALDTNEAAAQKRVGRAVEKLRRLFAKRGVVVPSAIVASCLSFSANSVQAAPALAKTISAVAITKGAAAGSSTLTLVKGALKAMAWMKAKTATVLCVGALLAAGTATVTVEKLQKKQDEWKPEYPVTTKILFEPPYRTAIVPTKFPTVGPTFSYTPEERICGINYLLSEIFALAYMPVAEIRANRGILRTNVPEELLDKRYDFISNLPKGSKSALQEEIRKKFGLTGRFVTIETNVFFLKLQKPHSPGLRESSLRNSGGTRNKGYFSAQRTDMKTLANILCDFSNKLPIIDKTGLTNGYDFEIHWEEKGPTYPDNFNAVNKALTDQLGLELVPGVAPVEFLEVSRVKN